MSLMVPFLSVAQTKKIRISGVVKDKETGDHIPGVTISAGNPAKVVGIADSDGKFVVNIDENTTLVFEAVGFTALRNVKARADMKVSLQKEYNAMQEAVVTGYVKKSRETTTGSTVIITAKDIRDVPSANVMDLLQGKVAGLNINTSSGAPGSSGTILLRGLSNPTVTGTGVNAFLTPTSPLFVVDGVPVDVNTNYQYGFDQQGPGISPISLIPQEDIEQIEVLKDAQATTLYGSRGAYGVIIITTKRGKSKVPVVQISAKGFASTIPQLRDVIGGKEERMARIYEIMNYDTSYIRALTTIDRFAALTDSLNPYFNNSTNWQDIFYNNAMNQSYNINILGGDQKFNYKTNLGYFNQQGVIKNTGFQRYSVNINMAYQPVQEFKMIASVTGAVGVNQKGSGAGLLQSDVAARAKASSLLPRPSDYGENSDVLGSFKMINDNRTNNISTNLEIQYEFLPGVRASSVFNYTHNSNLTHRFIPMSSSGVNSHSYDYNNVATSLYNRSMLFYTKSIKQDHNVSVYAISEIRTAANKYTDIATQATANDQIQGPFGAGNYSGSKGSAFSEQKGVSFAGNFSYDYQKKYVLSFNYLSGRNSTDGPRSPYSRNPSVGLRWNFNKEKWFDDNLLALDYGSVRFGWGSTTTPVGNIYDTYGIYVQNGKTFNNIKIVGVDFGASPNPNLVPATKQELNFGTELGFWKGRLSVIAETYFKENKNNLFMRSLSPTNGFAQIKTNELSSVNYGYELTVSVKPLPLSSKFAWTISANGAIDHEVLTHLPGGQSSYYVDDQSGSGLGMIYQVGKNSLSSYLFNSKGVYASLANVPVDPATGKLLSTKSGIPFQPGDVRWTDLDGNYIIDNRDKVAVGNAFPLLVGGLTSYMSYSNWSVNIATSFKFKRDVINNVLAETFQNYANPTALGRLLPLDNYNVWSYSGQNAAYANPFDYTRSVPYTTDNLGQDGPYMPFRPNQTMFMEDGSYWKINSITLSYNLNKGKIKKYGMSSARITGSISNVYTFTKYTGPDPENVTDLGFDRSDGYPIPRNFSLGLDIQF